MNKILEAIDNLRNAFVDEMFPPPKAIEVLDYETFLNLKLVLAREGGHPTLFYGLGPSQDEMSYRGVRITPTKNAAQMQDELNDARFQIDNLGDDVTTLEGSISHLKEQLKEKQKRIDFKDKVLRNMAINVSSPPIAEPKDTELKDVLDYFRVCTTKDKIGILKHLTVILHNSVTGLPR